MERLNPTEYQKLLDANKKQNKYRNKWVIIDKIKFQSTGEGNYYLRLKDDLRKGEILGFKRQVDYVFVINGVKITTYRADFVVKNLDGSFSVLDYKSSFTMTLALYQIKKALMQVCFNIIIKEVGPKLKKK